jgi:hypothetical protein
MPEDYVPIVIDDTKVILLYERMKYQDLPMLFILILSLISHMATGKVEVSDDSGAEIAVLMYEIEHIPSVQILLTLASILSGYISYTWRIQTVP